MVAGGSQSVSAEARGLATKPLLRRIPKMLEANIQTASGAQSGRRVRLLTDDPTRAVRASFRYTNLSWSAGDADSHNAD